MSVHAHVHAYVHVHVHAHVHVHVHAHVLVSSCARDNEFMTAVLVRSCLSATIDPRGGGGRGGLARPYVCLTRPLGGAL